MIPKSALQPSDMSGKDYVMIFVVIFDFTPRLSPACIFPFRHGKFARSLDT